MFDKVKLLINGTEYTGWTSVSVRRSIETLSGSFEIVSIDPSDDRALLIKPNQSCAIYLDSDLILTGFIDGFAPMISEQSRSITLNGRCRTADLIDCSAVYKSGTWSGNVSLLKLCKDLCYPFGIKVFADASDLGSDLKNFSLNTGESVFEAIQRACQNRAVLPVSDTSGNLRLTVAGNDRAESALQTGVNIKSASGQWNYENRFSLYQIKGQTSNDSGGWGESQISISGRAEDKTFPRYRPKIFAADGILTNADAQKKVAWEMQVRAGQSNSVSVTIAGWRQKSGKLWRENQQVYTLIPELRVDTDLLISELVYTQSNKGTDTSMILNPISIYAKEPKNIKTKTGDEVWGGWGTGASSNGQGDTDEFSE
jgi:prophage tail gpP-like protein